MTARILVIVIALALAGLTAFLMQNYLIGTSGTAEAPDETTAATKILVADKDLPAGTILDSGHWRWQSWPADAIDEEHHVVESEESDPKDVFGGAAVRRVILAGEPLTKARVVLAGDKSFLAVVLKKGMRAVGIQISAVSSAGGFIRPGDRVDVILTQQLRRRDGGSGEAETEVVSNAIMCDIRVLAIDQILDDVNKEAKVGKTATVEVSRDNVRKVTLAARMGRLSLALRSLTRDEDPKACTGITKSGEISLNTEPLRERRILVAARDLPATALLNDTDLHWWTPPDQDRIVTEHYVEVAGRDRRIALRGAVIVRAIEKGRPLSSNSVILPGRPGHITATLRPGRVPSRLGRKAVASVAGLAAPGDLVDVVLKRRLGSANDLVAGYTRDTVMRRLGILALDVNGGTADLEMTPRQKDALATVGDMGEVSLSLSGGTRRAGLSDPPPRGKDEIGRALATLLEKAKIVATRVKPVVRIPAILVAARDLPARALLRDTDLRWSTPDNLGDILAEHYVAGEGRDRRLELRGAVMVHAVEKGRPLSSNSVVLLGTPGHIAAALKPGTLMVSLDKTAAVGISAFAAPGDEVDVMLTQKSSRKSADGASVIRHTSETVLTQLRILALNSKQGTTALEVRPWQAAKLAEARKMGDISLMLRSIEKTQATNGGNNTTRTEPDSGPITTVPRVLVAIAAIKRGQLLRDSHVGWRQAKAGDETGGYVEGRNRRSALRGALVTRDIAADAKVAMSDIITPGTPGFLAAALTSGRRAISIAVDAVSGVSGFVAPDDRVDIILTLEIQTSAKEVGGPTLKLRRFSETILRGVRVLAIEQSVDPKTGQPVAGKTATIEVTPKDAEIVALAATMGRLSLSLGVPSANDGGDTPGRTFTSDLGISAAASDFISRGRRSMAPRPPPGASASAPPSPGVGVKLYRGATAFQLNFTR